MEKKIILITGASSGIGKELAFLYAEKQYVLLLLARDVERLEMVAAQCLKLGASDVVCRVADVTDRVALREAFQDIESLRNVDILFVNAGSILSVDSSAVYRDVLQQSLSVNFYGAVETVELLMSCHQNPANLSIVLISSVAGILVLPNMQGRDLIGYCVGKRALRIYGQAIRALYSERGVRVSVVCPGAINTPLVKGALEKLGDQVMPVSSAVSKLEKIASSGRGFSIFPLSAWVLVMLKVVLPFSWYVYGVRYRMAQQGLSSEGQTLSLRTLEGIKNPKVILITGASSGVGSALAQEYAAPGVTLILLGRDKQRLEKIRQLCLLKKATVDVASVDVRDQAAMHQCLEGYDAKYSIELVIASAGISAGVGNSPREEAEQMFDIFRTNIEGVLNTVEPLLPYMVKRGSGQIAIISSVLGFVGLPGQPSYCASKAAVNAYAESLRLAHARDGIRVNVICPVLVRTPMSEDHAMSKSLFWLYRYLYMSPQVLAFHVKNKLVKNKALIVYPRVIGRLVVHVLSLLPHRVGDWVFKKYLPRKSSHR